jgi:hypothetical protein
MWNKHWTFSDYLELRRRVEESLARGQWLFLNAAVFIIVALAMIGTLTPAHYYIEPTIGYGMALWSLLLAAHGIWTYTRSSAVARRRSQAIDNEIHERVENDDTYLSDNPKDLFRLHRLLEEDIRKRSWVISLGTGYTFLNALIWIPWAVMGADSLFAWMLTPFLALMVVLPLLGIAQLARVWHEHGLRHQMEGFSEGIRSQEESPKPKRDSIQSALRLTADGELVAIEDKRDMLKTTQQ